MNENEKNLFPNENEKNLFPTNMAEIVRCFWAAVTRTIQLHLLHLLVQQLSLNHFSCKLKITSITSNSVTLELRIQMYLIGP